YEKNIQVLLASSWTRDTREIVNNLLNQRFPSISLPVIPYQQELAAYFPHRFVPHVVWIRKGEVIAITSSEAITSSNIDLAISGQPIKSPPKIDDVEFSKKKPLLVGNNGGVDSMFLFRSILVPYIPGIGTTVGWQGDEERVRFYGLNQTVSNLLKMAYPKMGKMARNRWVVTGHDSIYLQNLLIAEGIHNRFSYELIIPKNRGKEWERFMAEDMRRYLGVEVEEGLESLKVLEISVDPSRKVKVSKFTKPEISLYDNVEEKYVRGLPISQIVSRLDHYSPHPLIFVSDSNPITDIELPDNFHGHINEIMEAFRNAGLSI